MQMGRLLVAEEHVGNPDARESVEVEFEGVALPLGGGVYEARVAPRLAQVKVQRVVLEADYMYGAPSCWSLALRGVPGRRRPAGRPLLVATVLTITCLHLSVAI